MRYHPADSSSPSPSLPIPQSCGDPLPCREPGLYATQPESQGLDNFGDRHRVQSVTTRADWLLLSAHSPTGEGSHFLSLELRLLVRLELEHGRVPTFAGKDWIACRGKRSTRDRRTSGRRPQS